MAQFVAFVEGVEVNKAGVLSVVNSMEANKESRTQFLTSNGILIDEQEWYPQQNWLNAFREIAEQLGGMNILLIGRALIKIAEIPPMENLKEALHSLDVIYHMNHRLNGVPMFDPATGKMLEGIGHYHVTEYNEEERKAVMVCNNPYPSKFDEGLLSQLVVRFKPERSFPRVTLDATKETRLNGGDSCTYLISW